MGGAKFALAGATCCAGAILMLVVVRLWPEGNDKLYRASSRVVRFFRSDLEKDDSARL